jgi:hypothetical protein
MDEKGFRLYLEKSGRSASAVNRCIRLVSDFENYLHASKQGTLLEDVKGEDLTDFVLRLDGESKTKAKGYLWAIRYYYDFRSNAEIRELAGMLRSERIERSPFALKKLRGVNSDYIDMLEDSGVNNVDQMLAAGATSNDRVELANTTGIPQSVILELVKLSDLARIPGVKNIRARLYYDAGIDTVEKIAALEPEELREKVVAYVDESGFEGIPTLPSEAKYTVEKARELPFIVEY